GAGRPAKLVDPTVKKPPAVHAVIRLVPVDLDREVAVALDAADLEWTGGGHEAVDDESRWPFAELDGRRVGVGARHHLRSLEDSAALEVDARSTGALPLDRAHAGALANNHAEILGALGEPPDKLVRVQGIGPHLEDRA